MRYLLITKGKPVTFWWRNKADTNYCGNKGDTEGF